MDNLKGELNLDKQINKLGIRIVISVFILYSYFHATPFPLDKPLIALCTFVYFLFNVILELYDKYYVKDCFADYDIQVENLKKYPELKKAVKSSSFILRLKSEVVLYTNKYTLKIMVNDKTVEEEVKYNEYLHNDGLIAKYKLNELIERLLKKI